MNEELREPLHNGLAELPIAQPPARQPRAQSPAEKEKKN